MTQSVESTMFRAKRHRHTFSALWFYYGPHKPQDVHVHPCQDDDCYRVLVGEGRECIADAPHHRETPR